MNDFRSDIRGFLHSHLPNRFQHLDPNGFENFMGFVLEQDGYMIKPVAENSAFGPHAVCAKEDYTVVVLFHHAKALKKADLNLIELGDAARQFYEADHAWIISTSDWEETAQTRADEADVELWDWAALEEALTSLFPETPKEPIHSHAPVKTGQIVDDPEFKLKVKWEPVTGLDSAWYNLKLVVTNESDRHRYVHLDLPAMIDFKGNQLVADEWMEGEFSAGMIYAGASVRTNALFHSTRAGDRPPGGKVVLTCHERDDIPKTFHLQSRLRGEACYIVTHCFGVESPEYERMTRFRDNRLSKSLMGRKFICAYYAISPVLIELAGKNILIDKALRQLASSVIRQVVKWI